MSDPVVLNSGSMFLREICTNDYLIFEVTGFEDFGLVFFTLSPATKVFEKPESLLVFDLRYLG